MPILPLEFCLAGSGRRCHSPRLPNLPGLVVVAQYNLHNDPYPIYDAITGDLVRYDYDQRSIGDGVSNYKYLAIRGTDDLYDMATDIVSLSLLVQPVPGAIPIAQGQSSGMARQRDAAGDLHGHWSFTGRVPRRRPGHRLWR